MKKIVLAVACVSSLGFAGGDMKAVEPAIEPVAPMVEADKSGFYAGLGLSAVSTRDSDVSMNIFKVKEGQDRLGNIALLGGYNFNEYIAVEGRYSTTFTEEDVVSMDSQWSLFVKPQYPVNEDFSVYGLLGYGEVKLSGENGISDTNLDESGFQWGIGVSYVMTEELNLFIDYTSLLNDKDIVFGWGGPYYNGATQIDVDAITMGVTYNF